MDKHLKDNIQNDLGTKSSVPPNFSASFITAPIYGDYHTHTVYSHGKGSVEQNAAAAAKLGLKELAITDHGFKHCSYNVRRMDWPYIKKDIEKAAEKHSSVKIYLGMESNILDSRGNIDAKDYLDSIDILICGYHKFTHTTSLKEFFAFSVPVFMAGLINKSSAKRIVENTDAYVRAIERFPIDIIVHPNHGIKTDLKEIAKAAAYFGTFLEINGKRICFSKQEAHIMLDEGAKFIVDSDSHCPDRVGDVSMPLQFIKDAGIPKDAIVNLFGKKPLFRGQKLRMEKKNECR